MIDTNDIVYKFLTESVSAPASGSLSAELSATATGFSVGAGQGASFESNGMFPVICGSEAFLVTRSSDTFTVIRRGGFGTTAAIHASGATVSQANLYTLVNSRVYTPRWPDGVGNDAASVLFEDGGAGEFDSQDGTSTASLLFTCRGGSLDERECTSVARLLVDRLFPRIGGVRRSIRCESTQAGSILLASMSGGIAQTFNLDPEWPETEINVDLVCRGN